MGQKTYRIGEAAAKLNLKSYVLRFWETEFSQIAPIRTEKGQRLYTESDLAVLGRIRYLLHERGLTIDGARRLLAEEAAKGTLYANPDGLSDGVASYAMDGGAEDGPAGGYLENDEEFPLEGEETESRPVQASLFPLPEREENPSPGESELEAIIMELAAIHRLLVSDGSGDMP